MNDDPIFLDRPGSPGSARLRPAFAFLACLALLFGASCAAEEGESSSTTAMPDQVDDDTTTSSTSGLDPVCTADTYTVAFPRGWHTNDASDGEPCSWFHPEEFDVPENSEAPGIAVHLRYDAVDFDFVTDPSNQSAEVLDRREVEVDGRRTVRMHTRSTGEGLLDKGVESVTWYVDTPTPVFVGATHGVAPGGIEENAPVLDQMMSSLQFTEQVAADSPSESQP